ncbi:hypothetical protein [Streptomyces sp. NPDC018352]|uniref:hypothetical protein n=1 Tax=Streptomyces sp. NPDC018352 TaxID=3157194 RepID=UPI0033EAACAD
MFDLTDVIELKATSEDAGVLDALLHAKAHRTPARDYIPDRDADGEKIDVSFATQNWQKVIRDRRRPSYFVRRHFEAIITTEDYDTRLDIDFTTLEDQRVPASNRLNRL